MNRSKFFAEALRLSKQPAAASIAAAILSNDARRIAALMNAEIQTAGAHTAGAQPATTNQ